MSVVTRFDLPAFLPDFSGIPGQAEAWHTAVDGWFEASIEAQSDSVLNGDGAKGTVQFYNPARFEPEGVVIEQAIPWNAFPKELLRRYGRERALREADKLEPLSQYSAAIQGPVLDRTYYRPLTEYCEWHVLRDPGTGKITRVTFTSEPPELWQALFGDALQIKEGFEVKFPGRRKRVLDLYKRFVSPDVRMDDLICQETIASADGQSIFAKEGAYNPYNKWNTTHGIMHLNAPPNSLSAEIQLGADATVLRKRKNGAPLSEPDALVCCAAYGGPDRNSDPTIGATVNSLARLGAFITLPNPVGLYMNHIDTAGWTTPEGSDVSECITIARGRLGMIERLVVEAPPGSGFVVGDLRIGGEPIEYGGQIAECITVKLIGAAAQIGAVHNAPVDCTARCCIDCAHALNLQRPVPLTDPCPPGTQSAFETEGAVIPETIGALTARAAGRVSGPVPSRRGRM